MVTFKVGLACTALVTAVAAAACGGSQDSGAEVTPTAPAAAAPAEPPAETSAEGGGLVGRVGPGLTIILTKDGSPVTELAAGTYTIEVYDEALGHNFHLMGPGVDETTDVASVGKTTWEVTLAAGKFTFLCDPHAARMKGTFFVT